jgi:uncharacterized membrane protein YbhN (UPF0104 family)
MAVTGFAPGGRNELARPARRSRVRTAALIAASLVLLWLLRPVLTAVYGDLGDIPSIDARWVLAIIGCEATSFAASWELNRLALRTDGWFDVAVAQLSGNAASNVVPAGGRWGCRPAASVLGSGL